MQDFLAADFAGRPVSQWIIALAWVLGGFLFGRILSWFSATVLKRLAAKTTTKIDDIILAFVEKPLVFIVTLAGLRLGADKLGFPGKTGEIVDKGYMILVTFAVAWALVKVIDAIIEEYLLPYAEKSEGRLDDQLVPIARNLVGVFIWSAAALIALTNAGYDVGAILAGLGIGGVAVALAAKDTLSNFFGSIAVFVDRPFRINDRIKVLGFDGTVIEIGLRTSRLRTLDGRVVTMPNANFSANAIENVSSEPSNRISATVDIAQTAGSAGIDRAIASIKAGLRAVPGLTGDPDVGVSSFSDIGIRLNYVFFVDKKAPWLATVSAGHVAVLRAIEAEGLSLATRSTLPMTV
ncbi:MAG: mechanosensitive ion channel family protein [Treponema sp.]|nr:mechanosensitive ion channel family protein [Treponema sp.]